MDTLGKNGGRKIVFIFICKYFYMEFFGGLDQTKELPWSEVCVLLDVGFKDDGGIVGDAEKDQVESNKVDDHRQEHHGGPSEVVVLEQQPKQTST